MSQDYSFPTQQMRVQHRVTRLGYYMSLLSFTYSEQPSLTPVLLGNHQFMEFKGFKDRQNLLLIFHVPQKVSNDIIIPSLK